ncbi:MAG: hypothetical protein J6A37_03545 [Oscillospiraceae bacterium]|nr:hypothetical protein [Oscillospiraceae bacterium]
MKSRRRTQQKAAQGIIFYLVGALIGAIIGAFGVSALTNKEESSERTATVYSTTGAEN